jgi:hypothetical protein
MAHSTDIAKIVEGNRCPKYPGEVFWSANYYRDGKSDYTCFFTWKNEFDSYFNWNLWFFIQKNIKKYGFRFTL